MSFSSSLRGRLRLLILLPPLLLLNGCTGLDALSNLTSGLGDLFADDDTADPPAVLPEEFKGEVQLELVWKDVAGKGTDQKYLKLQPAVANGRLYVADIKGLLQARQLNDGDVVWENNTEFPFASGPVVNGDLLIMGTSHGEVVGFDAHSGKMRWMREVSSEVLATPVVAGDKVIVRTTDGKVIAVRLQDGGIVWSAEHNVPALSIRGAGAPLVVDDKVVAGAANGKLMAWQLSDGKALWESTVVIPSGRSEVERLVDLDADPIEARNTIFICSYQNGSAAVTESDGEVLWRNESISSHTGISADWRYLYITDSHSEVWQVDQRTGASLWSQKELHNRQLTAVTVYGGYAVAGDFEGYVHWLSLSDGRLLARIKIGKAAIAAKPVEADGVVYVFAKDGGIAAIRAK